MVLDQNKEAGTITLLTNKGYIFGDCTCGQASITSIKRALELGVVSCDCGAEATVDTDIIDRLKAEEPEFRF